MRCPGMLEKLTEMLNCKTYVRSGVGKEVEFANQLPVERRIFQENTIVKGQFDIAIKGT